MQTQLTHIVASLVALTGLAAASQVQAQVLINQEKALSGTSYGWFQDSPGFPVTIIGPGSYKLTSNLIVPAGATGVEILGSGATLDLNGFSIGTATACNVNEATFAVNCNGGQQGNVGVDFKQGGNTVRNGRINGFVSGIYVKGGDHLEDLLVENNAFGVRGLPHHGARTIVRNLRVQRNELQGFSMHSALISNSTASGNGHSGFNVTDTLIIDSFASRNGEYGFRGIPGFAGSNAVMGRTMGTHNKLGDWYNMQSVGGNINTNLQVQ